VGADGNRDVLGIWIEQSEGAKFWLKVMNELRNRGVEGLRKFFSVKVADDFSEGGCFCVSWFGFC
jgi:transposase-like protein